MADQIGVELSGDGSKFSSMLDSSASLAGKFNQALGAIGVGVSLAGVINFGKSVVDQAGKLQDLSDRLGVSTDALQALDYHAKLAGSDISQVAGVFDKTRKAIDGLMEGQKLAEDNFARIGLSAKNFIGLNLEQSVQLIAKAYGESSTEAGAYDAITDIMGTKTMPKLNAVLLQYGAEGAQTFIDKTKEMGVIASTDTIKQLDDLGDRFTTVTAKAKKSGMEIVVFIDTWNEKIGTLIKTMANAVGIKGGPFAQAAVETKQIKENVENTIPVVDKLTERERENVKLHMQKSKESLDGLARSERVNQLVEQELNIQRALEQVGVSKAVQEALNISLEETRKQLKTEQKGLDADEAKHAERMTQLTAKQLEEEREKLPLRQQINKLKEDEAGWVELIELADTDAETRRYAEFELAKTRAKMRDVELGKKKEDVELATLLLKSSDEITEGEKLRIEILRGNVSQRELEAEKANLIAGLVNGALTPADEARLRVLMGQTREIENQNKKIEVQNRITTKGKAYEAQSDDSLEGVRQRLRDQIEEVQRHDFGKPKGVGGASNFGLQQLELQLFNIEKEMGDRDRVRDYASRFGEKKARQEFGDTLTDKALRDWNDLNQRSTTALEDLQQRIATLLPKK